MKLSQRRQFLRLAAGAATLLAPARLAGAQPYPSRPVRWIVPSSPAGTTDILARLIGQCLSEQFSQPFVVENRPGGSSNIGTEVVVRAYADGYTLLLVAPSHAINATLYPKLNFDFIRDIAPVAGIITVPNIMVVHPSIPTRSLPEFIAYAKANPGKINMASSGSGNSGHLAGELLKMMTAIDMVHVPYRGAGPALTDLLSGQVQTMFATTPASIEYVRAGKLRALAVTAATRLQLLPDIPTVGEFVTGYEASAWYGIGVPKNTPSDIVSKLNSAINACLADSKIKARFDDFGGSALTLSPTEFGQLIADETEKWARVVRFAGLKPQ